MIMIILMILILIIITIIEFHRREELQQLAGLNNRLAFLVDKVHDKYQENAD